MSLAAGKEARIPYLDGLRGYSILTVLLDHSIGGKDHWLGKHPYLHALVGDGTLGVRIFFVLSGFLITTLLLQEEDKRGRISIRGFYERRIARIFPVFYLYLAVMLLLRTMHLLPLQWSVLASAATFTSNLTFLFRQGGAPDTTLVLGHFWTLSIEEQFYLIWPSCLVFLGRRWSLRLAGVVMVLLPLVRFAAALFLPDSHSRTWLLYRTAQDQILWGVLAAFLVHGGALERLRYVRYRLVLLIAPLLVIFVLCPALNWYTPFGTHAWLVPTLQTASTVVLLFWLLSGEGGLLRRALESWPAVQLGLLSYSLYIWQQPFTEWSRLSVIPFPVNILLALCVAIVSYRVVEIPSRRRLRLWFAQGAPAHT